MGQTDANLILSGRTFTTNRWNVNWLKTDANLILSGRTFTTDRWAVRWLKVNEEANLKLVFQHHGEHTEFRLLTFHLKYMPRPGHTLTYTVHFTYGRDMENAQPWPVFHEADIIAWQAVPMRDLRGRWMTTVELHSAHVERPTTVVFCGMMAEL